MKRVMWLVLAFVLTASAASAQVERNTFEVAGFTGFLLNRQTIEPADAEGGEDFNATTATVTIDGTYYFSSVIGVGVYLSYNRFTAGPSESRIEVTGGLVGPQLKLRLPLGDRASFVLSGAGGITKDTIKTGVELGDLDDSQDGKFWMAGGYVSILIADNASFDFGARYQRTRVTFGAGEDEVDLDVAGILGGVGFSVYFK
jgi:opacity protein-like surface antigen